MITVYGYSSSGNCHKLKLLLTQLEREFKWVEVDSTAGQTRTPEYLARNPNGKVPMIELEDGRVLTESNAIMCWLAEGTPYWAGDAWQRAQVLSWLFFEQYSHEPYIAVARFIRGWTPLDSPRRASLPQLRERGHQALAVMEQHLKSQPWFSGEAYGIADIALFAYTGVAGDGGFDLEAYPAIRQWLERVKQTPRFIEMPGPSVEAVSRLAVPD
ncbi:glutathione S-transferase family protein [Lysobacter sp.]|uniref:glutathione S-transferase family protein n=1 Tax=Lysobacter sp. TaxID=72226 RepID=UPI002D271E6E|nr:glutathione S-transferase family protein [Lysobacter sp.]HZX77826.1 glutathione S-transferase family protein [Lysobacter sp.]